MILTQAARVHCSLPDDTLLFLSMTGTDTLGQPFDYELELLSADEQIDLTQLLGQPMLVTLGMQQGLMREFSGFVTRFVLAGELGRYVKYRATLRPWLWMLSRRSNSRIFQEKTVPQVIMALFREHEFTDFEDQLTNKEYRTWEYLVQYRETDFNFVSRLMQQEGIYYYFRHTGSKHILVLSDSYSAHEPVPGYEVLPYIPKTRDHVMEDHIDSWRAVRQITSGAITALDYDFEAPRAQLGSTLSPGSDYPGGNYELFEYPGEFIDNEQANEQVRLRLEAVQAEHDIVRGAGNARGLHAGALMTLSEFPRADQNKEYLIVSTHIEIRIDNYESLLGALDFTEEPSFRCSFAAMDAKRPFRVIRSTPKPIVRGPQTATVVGQAGQEIWTDKYGRVKVQFRWDREGEADENSSCWVRVAQIWAGTGWGGIHIPRIGQEVIVDFLEGNPDRPIITGRLYNADNMPPYELPQNQTQSGIKSHSTKGGTQDNFNEIRFEDKKGEEELYIQAEKNMTTLVKNDQGTTVQANRSAGVTGNDSVSVGGDRSVSVTGNLTITVSGNGSGSPQSNHTVTGSHSLSTSDKIEITAPNEIKLTCGGSSITMTPDRIVIHAGGGSEVALDANGRFESSQASKMFLDANAKIEASGGANVLFDANVNMLSNAGDQLLLDGSAKLNSPGDVIFDGVKITGTGSAEASFTVGGQSLKLTPASADVGGSMVNVQGQSLVSIKAGSIMIG